MATLSYSSNVLAFADADITSDPQKKYVDWSRSTVISVNNPLQIPYTLEAGSSVTVFNGTRSTSISSSTEFQLTISSLSADRYRFTWDGTGTNPVFRTNRNLTPNGHTLTWVVNINQTLSLTSSTVGEFTAVQVGDDFFVPGLSTGDSSGPFNVLNEGFWKIIAKNGSSTTIQLSRPTGTDFSGFSQVVIATSNTNIIAYSAAGVQAGDSVVISNGFSAPVLRTFSVDRVTPTWFEILTTIQLPISETGVPGTSGMIFYTNSKRFIKIEADQDCIVQLNGDTGQTCRLSPWYSGDGSFVAEYVKTGPTWQLVLTNVSSNNLNVLVISAE